VEAGVNFSTSLSPTMAANDTPSSTPTTAQFPDHPGDSFLAHQGKRFREAADTYLTGAILLDTAKGHMPAECGHLIDVDMATIPVVPPDHRDFHRIRQECSKEGYAAQRSKCQ
jgi:hypothetical protein